MQRLGPYQLLRKIGRGGMAEVWSATHSVDGVDRFVAIKLLAPHLAEQSAYRDMFLAEARLSMLLDHPNIVRVFDANDQPPDCYMVMELVEGMTLSQLERALGKQGEKIPIDVGAYVIGELLRALGYAHGVSLDEGSVIVHRDVSPQNVMVTTAGEVKLMDFGIARFATEETQGNFVKGKLQYMPPEQLRKETRKPTIDLYAVGAILHELIDGRRFRGNIDQTRLFGMVIQGEIPALETTEFVPIELDQLRLALLEAEEDRRIQSAQEAHRQLERWSDYRHAAPELQALVQCFVAPSSSTSSSPGFEPEDSSSGAKRPDPAPDLGTHASSSSESNLRRVDHPAAAETLQDGVEETDTSLDRFATLEHRRRRWMWAGVSLLVLGGIGGTALILANQTDDDHHQTEIEPDAAIEPEPEPVDPPVEPDVAAEDPTVPDEAERVLVWVEFVTKEVPFVYVRVNGRVLSLDPKSRVRLPVGSFNVYLRINKHGKWIKAGRITLEADQEYRVEMRWPADLTKVVVRR